MMSETPNRAAADLLSKDLLDAPEREALLDAAQPALLLAGDASVLFASHAFARRLGHPDGESLLRAGLPRLAPGSQRLASLAAQPPQAAWSERLRFPIGGQSGLVPVEARALLLANGASALLVTLAEGATNAARGGFAGGLALGHPAAPAKAAEEAAPPAAEVVAPKAPRPSRFVFSLDNAGRIAALSPAFHAALGGSAATFLGQSIAGFAATLDRHAGEAIEKAVAAGTTWGGIRLNWPLAEEDCAVPVVLSAMPRQDAGRLDGFSGFGRVLFEQAVPLSPATTTPTIAAAIEPSAAPQVATSDAATMAAAEAGLPEIAALEMAEEETSALEVAEPQAAATEVMAPEVMAPEIMAPEVMAPEVMAPEVMTPEVMAPEIMAPEVMVPQAEAAEAASGPREGALIPGPVERAEAGNVVSLRPGQIDLPPGLPPHINRPGLSLNERNAFSEIARALGAKFESLATGPTAPAQPRLAPIPAAPIPAAPIPAAPIPLGPTLIAPEPPAPEPPAPEPLVAPPVVDDLFAAEPAVAAPIADKAMAPETATPPADAPPACGDEAAEEEESPEISLVDALPIGVLVLRGEEPLYANRTLLDLTGYADLAEFIARDGGRMLFRKGAQPRGCVEGFETVVLATCSGETIPVDAHVQLVEWGGAPASLMAFRRAVEMEQSRALKSVAQDLRRMRHEAGELRSVLDTATDGVLTLDESGAILSLNHAAEALFGLHQNEVVGSSFMQLLHNESHASVLDYFEGLKTNGVRSVLNDGREVWGKEKKGGRIPLFLTFGRISDAEPRRFCAVLRDLTAWKRAEGELTEARKAAENASAKKSDFLAKVGHEIRTPMNAIIGFAELMLEERLGPINNPKYREYLGDIRASGLHVVSLVNDLLDLSKIEAGRMELHFAASDINAIVIGCVGLIQPQATQLRVLVRSQLAAKLPNVVADERSIRQILINLLSNATRFTPAGGQVLVATVLQDSGEAVIRIRDTGAGMSPAEIEQALESYRQVGPRRENGGTGLGLPLSKALAEANRANFSIRSAPGEGTTVEISFPPTRVLAE